MVFIKKKGYDEMVLLNLFGVATMKHNFEHHRHNIGALLQGTQLAKTGLAIDNLPKH